MPARAVDQVLIYNWIDTGLTTPFARYKFTIKVTWMTEDGVKHVHGPQEYIFPNDLSDMPLLVRKKHAEQMIMEKVRVALGINEWSDFQ